MIREHSAPGRLLSRRAADLSVGCAGRGPAEASFGADLSSGGTAPCIGLEECSIKSKLSCRISIDARDFESRLMLADWERIRMAAISCPSPSVAEDFRRCKEALLLLLLEQGTSLALMQHNLPSRLQCSRSNNSRSSTFAVSSSRTANKSVPACGFSAKQRTINKAMWADNVGRPFRCALECRQKLISLSSSKNTWEHSSG